MPLVSMRQLLDHAAECGYGIPAFNVNNLEQVQALLKDGSLQADGKNIATYDYNGGVTRGMVHKAPWSRRRREHPDDIAWIKWGQSGDILAIDRIKEIDRYIPNTDLVMGSSLQSDGKNIATYDYNDDVTRQVAPDGIGAVVESEIDRLESREVTLWGMRGIGSSAIEEIQEAIKHGVRQIDIDTSIERVGVEVRARLRDAQPGPLRRCRRLFARGGSQVWLGLRALFAHPHPPMGVCHG